MSDDILYKILFYAELYIAITSTVMFVMGIVVLIRLKNIKDIIKKFHGIESIIVQNTNAYKKLDTTLTRLIEKISERDSVMSKAQGVMDTKIDMLLKEKSK